LSSNVYLIPSLLDENAHASLPAYIIEAVKDCKVFFVEDERSARRFLKSIWKEMVIDDYEWFVADKTTIKLPATGISFRNKLKEGKNIGIISEAGCPGVADPGQQLIAIAHANGGTVKPLVGPNSILLALMASGMNGQLFTFVGYLPIDNTEKIKAIREMESESARKNCTQIFMETPYRNNQLLESLVKTCKPSTRLCIAANITGSKEFIHTQSIEQWKKKLPDLHKQPAIFCLLSSS
jgi:16S rRNA (cytidine1402-2'-O)-methyltransferase